MTAQFDYRKDKFFVVSNKLIRLANELGREVKVQWTTGDGRSYISEDEVEFAKICARSGDSVAVVVGGKWYKCQLWPNGEFIAMHFEQGDLTASEVVLVDELK